VLSGKTLRRPGLEAVKGSKSRSCCLTLVFVDKTAELVATADHLALRWPLPSLIEFGRPEFERTMRPPAVVMVDIDVAVFGLVFAAGDGRELAHQLDDSNSGLAAVAALLLVLHLAVAALAAAAIPRRGGSTSLPLRDATG
jgi:hypothetical protein